MGCIISVFCCWTFISEIEISENTDEIYGTNPAFRIQVVFPLYNYFIPSWLVLYIDISKNNFFHPELKCFL